MYRLIFILFGFQLAWPVAAEDLQNSLEACTALPDKAAQLACFDGLEAGPVAAPAAQDGLQDQLEFCLALANKRDQLACFDRVGASNPEPGVPDARADRAVGAVPTLQSSLEACIRLPLKPEQLACFEELGAGAAPSASDVAQTGSVTGLGACIALTDKSGQLACFDAIRGIGPGASAARLREDTGTYEYQARLASVSDDGSFFMEDGQVWRALNPAPMMFRQDEVVIIRPEAGAFVMSQVGTDATAGVTRIR